MPGTSARLLILVARVDLARHRGAMLAELQHALISRAKSGEKVTAKHVAKKLQREARERDLASATEVAAQTLGKNVYGVIYADPPWRVPLRWRTSSAWH